MEGLPGKKKREQQRQNFGGEAFISANAEDKRRGSSEKR